MKTHVTFSADTNQALGVAEFCIAALSDDRAAQLDPSPEVVERTVMFFLDAVACGLSARALLTREGLGGMTQYAERAYRITGQDPSLHVGNIKFWGASLYGSDTLIHPSQVALLNGFAVRAWDANGTSFANYPDLQHTQGEFGHNDFYDAVVAACQMARKDGAFAIRAMILLDEIRVRLGSVYSLKDRHLDHVFHGGIATAFVVGAILGATAEQIEQAVGLYVAHYVPTRANRAGDAEIADSKGAAAGMAAERGFEAVLMVMVGNFKGPQDIFRIPEGIFRLMGGPGPESKVFARADGKVPANIPSTREKRSPFDLVLTRAGGDFAIMQMHIKVALYEHQSAGALAGLLLAARERPAVLQNLDTIRRIVVKIYNPAADIICQKERRNPTTREAADHSCFFLMSTLLRKMARLGSTDWGETMLVPTDFSETALRDAETRALIDRIEIVHEPSYDDKYPDGIPTSVLIELEDDTTLDSGLVMYPPGHAKYDGQDFGPFDDLHSRKLALFGKLAFGEDAIADRVFARYGGITTMTADGLSQIHSGYTISDHHELMN